MLIIQGQDLARGQPDGVVARLALDAADGVVGRHVDGVVRWRQRAGRASGGGTEGARAGRAIIGISIGRAQDAGGGGGGKVVVRTGLAANAGREVNGPVGATRRAYEEGIPIIIIAGE